MRQQIDSWDKVNTQIGFIREKGKAAIRDGEGTQKIGSSLSFTKGGFLFGPFVGEGS
jgi:hypothetical protein